MILAGSLPLAKKESIQLNKLVKKISQDATVVVLPEITSNLYHKKFVSNFDNVLSTASETEVAKFQPDLLITVGGSFISKRIKLWLRKHPPKVHWHIDEIDYHLDTFQCLTTTINMPPRAFFEQLVSAISSPLPPPEGRAVKFCFCKFPNVKVLHEMIEFARCSLPLAGVGGWKTLVFVKFHPSIPASGEDCTLQTKNSGINFNILPIVKQNLTALLINGGWGEEFSFKK